VRRFSVFVRRFWAFRRVSLAFPTRVSDFRRAVTVIDAASIAVLPERQAILAANEAPSAVTTSKILARLVLESIAVAFECSAIALDLAPGTFIPYALALPYVPRIHSGFSGIAPLNAASTCAIASARSRGSRARIGK